MHIGVGEVAAVRDVLDRLDAAGVAAEHLTIDTPDLNDVFFALTGGGTVASRDDHTSSGTTTTISTELT